LRHNAGRPREVEFYRAEGDNPVVEELLALRRKNVDLAAEVVADLQDLERFGLALPRTRLHKVRGTKDLWTLRTECAGNIARSIFFEVGNQRCVVLTVLETKTDDLLTAALERAERRMATWDRTSHQ
jgi:phage-related protein